MASLHSKIEMLWVSISKTTFVPILIMQNSCEFSEVALVHGPFGFGI